MVRVGLVWCTDIKLNSYIIVQNTLKKVWKCSRSTTVKKLLSGFVKVHFYKTKTVMFAKTTTFRN